MAVDQQQRQSTGQEGSLRLDRYLLNVPSGEPISLDEFAPLIAHRSHRLAAHIFGGRLERVDRHSNCLSEDALSRLRNDLLRERFRSDRIALCELAATHVESGLAALVLHSPGRSTSALAGVRGDAEFGATEIVTEIATDGSTIDPGQLGAWMEFQKGLARLEPELRQIIHFVFFNGLTVAAAAELLSLPAGTVEERWRTAKIRLAMAGADLLPG